MPLRIDPRVDFACKKMLGSPDHPVVTIHFLNSILKLDAPIVSVEILNPLIGKDRPEAKVVVLDVLARDSLGRLFNIEMQTRLPLSFANRLLYYNCKNYTRQIGEGDGYGELRPSISICLLSRKMFWQKPDSARWHHSFRLRCDQNVELILTNDLEFHIIELPKYEPSSDNIYELPPDEKWVYLFKYAAEVEPERLAELLRDPPYREAIGVLQMISQSPEDLQYYEDRLKFLRDEQGKLLAAKQEGEQLGLARGREEGREEGREQGKLAGKIQMIQELLGDAVDSDEALLSHDRDTLTALLSDLQTRLRRREA